MQNINLTLIQSDIYWEDITANLAAFEEKIWKISEQTDVIILPEMFTTGFSMSTKSIAESMNMTTFKWMKQLSIQTGAVITGSYIVTANHNYFNRLIWMQPDGEFLFYDKKHLYRNSGESLNFVAGKEKIIPTWRGWKFCPLICYDLRFPIWSRNIWKNEQSLYDCLIYVANWPEPRHNAWQTLLKARAIENLSYCVGVNRIGKDENRLKYLGGSSLIDFKGNIIFEAENNNEIITLSLDRKKLNDFRAEFPFYLDTDNDLIL